MEQKLYSCRVDAYPIFMNDPVLENKKFFDFVGVNVTLTGINM